MHFHVAFLIHHQVSYKTYFKPKCDVISRKIETLQILECEEKCEDFFKWA